MSNLHTAYERIILNNFWEQDPTQRHAVTTLDRFQKELESHIRDESICNYNMHLLRRCMRTQKAVCSVPGAYIWGGVGCGKTMLMDLFYNDLSITHKRRMHFHDFMRDFHVSLRNVRRDRDSEERILLALRDMLDYTRVLCLDELQINNIADAMIIGRVFDTLLKEKVWILVTSNRYPSDLFKDGLQRERLDPFINMIIEKFKIIDMSLGMDYRLTKVIGFDRVYHYPLGLGADAFIEGASQELSGFHEWEERSIKIDENKMLRVLRSYGKVGIFHFNELCAMPLGAIDYVALCHHFNTIIIENIPQMGADQHNEALRFITLIDCLYNAKTRLVCTAAVSCENLYIGKIHRFEFERAISRLKEMQTVEYLSIPKEDAVVAEN